MVRLINTANTVILKIGDALSSIAGWLSAVILFFVNLASGYELAILFVVFSTFLDTVWGIAAAIKQHKFTFTEFARATMLSKWLLYASTIIVFIFMEQVAGIESHLSVIGICSVLSLVEWWSMCGSALIISPNMPIIRLMRHYLAGEVAHKMGMTKEEVLDYLNGKDDDNQNDENK